MRRRLVVSTALLVGLGLCGVVAQYVVAKPNTHAATLDPRTSASEAAGGAAPASSPSKSQHFSVAATNGTVELRGADGSWHALSSGDVLSSDDVIRTASASTAQLRFADHITVNVAEATELTIGKVSDSLSKLQLDDGRLATVVRGDSAYKLRVDIRGTGVHAETREGDFGVLHRGDSPVAVTTRQGSVQVTSQGERVDVAEGEQTIVESGKPPPKPSKVPSSLFLKLAKGVAIRRGDKRVQIRGESTPGVAVSVEGAHTSADGRGRFSRSIELREGAHVIVVEIEDALGRRVRREVPLITVDAPTPKTDIDANVKW